MRARRAACERRALSVHNLAFSPDGCSNVVKIIQLYRHRHPDHAILTTDVATAFQSAPRSQMERELYADADLRPLLPYFYALYADEASLFFGDDVLKSKEGCQQGCSLGTLLYILSIIPARSQPAGCQRAGSLWRARTQHSTPPSLSTRSSRAATSWR